jgi:hypothetical protein
MECCERSENKHGPAGDECQRWHDASGSPDKQDPSAPETLPQTKPGGRRGQAKSEVARFELPVSLTDVNTKMLRRLGSK